MKGKKSVAVMVGLCLVLLLAALPFISACGEEAAPAPAAPAAPAPAEKFRELSFSHFFSSESAQGKWLQMWADKMGEESDGRLDIRVYSSGVLIGPRDVYAGVATGIADIGYGPRYENYGHDISVLIGRFMAGVKTVPVATQIMRDCQAEFPEVAAEWETSKLICNHSHPPGHIHNNVKVVRVPEDMVGLEIRASNADAADSVEKLMGTPVVMPMSESYEALQKGTVDGILCPTEVLENFRLGEVLDYTTNLYLYMSPEFPLYMNWDTWNSLPADLQGVIESNMQWAQESGDAMWESIDTSAIEFMKTLKPGYTYTNPTPDELEQWYVLNREWLAEQAAKLNAKGYPGTQVYEFVQAKVKEYVK